MHSGEGIGSLFPACMPMITFASFVVIAQDALPADHIREPVLEGV